MDFIAGFDNFNIIEMNSIVAQIIEFLLDV